VLSRPANSPWLCDVRCYGELNDFLPPARRCRSFPVCCLAARSVKDVLEAAGVPHTEIRFVLVNGEPTPLAHVLRAACRLAAYPACYRTDLVPACAPPWPRPGDCRFVADVHLGKLARLLRLLGFDCLHDPSWDDPELARRSAEERRVLLTRDRGLLKRAIVPFGVCVRSSDPEQQAAYVLARLRLHGASTPGSRCLACNGLLRPATPEEARDRVPPRSLVAFDRFYVCASCARVFWHGSHWEHLGRLRDRLLGG
jgi:uncharacterized protein with PIN domain